MKPILSESEDKDALLALGRASVQIVHDLKNQLNGLKLYATFLRRRLEKTERPADELETANKLMSGLDRTASDLSLIVEFGQALHLKRQTDTDLEKIILEVAVSLNGQPQLSGPLTGSLIIDAEPGTFLGDFDPALLAGAFKSISLGAMRSAHDKGSPGPMKIHLKGEAINTRPYAVIEWDDPDVSDHDPFHSFAGSNAIRMSLAARVIEAHGGTAQRQDRRIRVRLPLLTS